LIGTPRSFGRQPQFYLLVPKLSLLSSHTDVAIPDSGAMVLLWRILRGQKITRISGLKYLQRLVRPRIGAKVTPRAARREIQWPS
jgi:hypothetical protein